MYAELFLGAHVPDGSARTPRGVIILTDMDGANLDRARSFLAAGGVDNRAVFEQGDAVDIAHEYDALRRVLTGEAATLAETAVAESARRGTAGVVEYLETVREDPDFETTLLALGDGVAVTTRTRR